MIKNRHIYIFVILIFAFSLQCFAQKEIKSYIIKNKVYQSSLIIDPDNFIPQLFEYTLIDEVNKIRIKKKIESFELNELLSNVAAQQAQYMAIEHIVSVEQKDKSKRSLSDRMNSVGGSSQANELVTKTVISKRGDFFTYQKLAYDVAFKWFISSKSSRYLENSGFKFMGVGVSLDELGKKCYISVVLGSYLSFNEGALKREELSVPYTIKKNGLKSYDERECRKISRYENLHLLQNGLVVNDNKIYFQTDDLKSFKKIVRNSKDGIAVDIVSNEQYTCELTNIVDNNLFNKGYTLKKVMASKLYKNNLISGSKVRSLKYFIGDFPEDIKGDYELNLMLIQNKHVCANLHQSFSLDGGSDYSKKVQLLADTITINANYLYEPKPDTTYLSFRVPFEKKKYTYKPNDIKPLLESLNEPEFFIHELSISAFSSIEGSQSENEMLQQKRAESIINAIKKLQKSNIITSIKTSDNWDQFRHDILTTEFDTLAKMSIEQAQHYINKIDLGNRLEKILSRHRYAQIDMKVTYDISGDKEEKYVISEFNKAISSNNLPKALSIQKFIFKNILNKRYSSYSVYEQNIPKTKINAGLLMNKLWLEKFISHSDLESIYVLIKQLYNLNKDNEYIMFNYVYADIVLEELGDSRKIQDIQKLIDNLYYSSFPKETVDALNIKFQLKIINANDKIGKVKIVDESINRLKAIVDVRDETSKSALKLAYLFIAFKEFDYAFKLLNPFVLLSDVSEDFLFTYASLCSYKQERYFSDKFIEVLQRAKEMNPTRFCDLFNGDYFSFQVFANPKVKKLKCEFCNTIVDHP